MPIEVPDVDAPRANGDGRTSETAGFLAAVVFVCAAFYVNQIAIALASPLTVRVVLAGAPALVFGLQLLEGRLSPSPYSFGAALFYGGFAAGSVFARQRAIRAAEPA